MTTPKLEEKKLSLRVLIDRERNKVLFAEADSDFVDVLFSFMTLPMGTIVRLVDKHFGPQKEAMGSFNTMYDGLRKLSSTCFWTEEAKLMLLNPKKSSETECQKLKLNIDDSEPSKYFICGNSECGRESKGGSVSVSLYDIARCSCGKLMNIGIVFNTFNVQPASGYEGVFTSGRASFIITDNLQVTPNYLVGSILELLNTLGIKDLTALEEKTFILGLKEIISLLKWSIVSKTPLSDVVLQNKPLKSETFCSAVFETCKDTRPNSMKMVVKVMVHKSTKKVLFAQAEEDFIDFLFSLLTIPLGSVVSLLRGNTSIPSLDNLYKSISSLSPDKYLKSGDVKTMLLDPKLPPQYLCKNQIFNLTEKSSPHLLYNSVCYYNTNGYNVYLTHLPSAYTLSSSGDHIRREVTFKDPKVKQGFVRGPAMFMVTDDLEVTPMSPISGISLLNRSGIPLCDVEEMVLSIGTEEALNILRASLSSASALTNGLNPMSMKQPKQEK